ncbi:MAG: hypothetical protein WBV71_17555 [Roseobacter sp.]
MTSANLSSQESTGETVNLKEVLHRFSTKSAWLAAERQTLPEAPRAQLEVLLREISETVLPRCIELTAKGETLATLTVSSRRLYAITSPKQDQSFAPDADARVFAAQLLELSKRATALTTRTIDDPSQISDTGNSCSVSALRGALVIDDRPCDIAHLADLLEATALAQMTWSSDPAKHVFSGAEAWHPLLQSHAERLTGELSGSKTAKFQAAQDATGVAIPISEDKVLIVACKDTLGIASVCPIEEGLKAISAWQISDI